MDETWMMTPECCFSIAGRKPRSRRTAENRFSSNSCCQTSSVNASTPPPGRGRTAETVDQYVKAAEPVEGCLDDVIRSRLRGAIRLNELFGIAARGDSSGSGEHRRPAASQAVYNGLANSFRASCDQDSLAAEFVCVVWDVRSIHGVFYGIAAPFSTH